METVLHYIKKYAETQPDTLAVCELKKHLTYAEYWKAIRKIANVLLQNGIKRMRMLFCDARKMLSTWFCFQPCSICRHL